MLKIKERTILKKQENRKIKFATVNYKYNLIDAISYRSQQLNQTL